MPKQPESKLKGRILHYLQGRGAYAFKVHGNEFQEAGAPDIFCCWHGMFIALELKVPGEDATPRQKYIMGKIDQAGGSATVVHSVEEVEQVLQRIARKRG